MADTLFQTLSLFFARYGYWAIFFGVMLENAGLPVPGETVLLFAGFLAFHGDISLGRAILTGIIAASLGDSLGYCLGRFAGPAFVARYVRRFKVLSRQFDRAQARFLRHGHWAVFVGRFITGLRVFAGPLAGMFRMAYLRFLFFNFSGALIWATAVGCVGFFFGSSWQDLVAFVAKFHEAVLVVAGGAALAAVVIYFRRRSRGRRATGREA